MRWLFAALIVVVVPAVAVAQFRTPAAEVGGRIERTTTQRVRVGVIVKAASPVLNALATIPVPDEWPEQRVRVVDEDITPSYTKVSYRNLDREGVRLMVVAVPRLSAGSEARALITFEVTTSAVAAPTDTAIYQVPGRVDRKMIVYLGTSPYIESRHPKIVSTARRITAERDVAWEKVRAIYDWVRDNVVYAQGDLKGAVAALYDGEGGADELTSLFVAMCRSQKIPARTVFVYGDCYAEFYLEDDEGRGRWFACQVASFPSFGTIEQPRAIFQKGDNFRSPRNPKERLRFVKETFTAAGRGKAPSVRFVRELVAE